MKKCLQSISKYDKINLLFLAFFLITFITHTISLYVNYNELIISNFYIYSFFIVFFLSLYLLKESKFTKILQVSLLYFISFFTIAINHMLYENGYILIIFIFFLSKKYLLFDKHPKLYVAVIFILVIISSLISFYSHPQAETVYISLSIVLVKINFLIASVSMILIIFEDDIRKLKELNKVLHEEVERNKIFSNIGENITGLIHNMKNDMSVLDIATDILEEDVGKDKTLYLKKSILRLENKISNMLTIAKYYNQDNDDIIHLNSFIDGIIEIFEINKDYKKVKIEKLNLNQLYTKGNPTQLSQIYENIIKNAYEALQEKPFNNGIVPKIKFKFEKDDDFSVITISDNANGIQTCLENENYQEDCMDCEVFEMGSSTKKNGTGFGMIFVIKELKKLNGKMKIKTSSDGTSVLIYLPYYYEGEQSENSTLNR